MRELVLHGVYKHYKGDYYIVEGVAKHSETGEKLVIYRGLYDDFQFVCARPYEMFLEEIELEKQEQFGQKYRFELQEIQSVRKD